MAATHRMAFKIIFYSAWKKIMVSMVNERLNKYCKIIACKYYYYCWHYFGRFKGKCISLQWVVSKPPIVISDFWPFLTSTSLVPISNPAVARPSTHKMPCGYVIRLNRVIQSLVLFIIYMYTEEKSYSQEHICL